MQGLEARDRNCQMSTPEYAMHGGRPSTTSLGQFLQYIQAVVYIRMKTWFVHFGINYGFLVNIHLEPTRPSSVSQFFRQY